MDNSGGTLNRRYITTHRLRQSDFKRIGDQGVPNRNLQHIWHGLKKYSDILQI